MLEDFFEIARSKWGFATAVLLLSGGRKMFRRAAKESVKLGYAVVDFLDEVINEDRKDMPAVESTKAPSPLRKT
ncbi:MAG: hypothetical protein KC777_03420 [Cyanobacteria bacterium HKST-UBA02]|nr:hypothetical protein [Cyanobacteria bacterium HKST-UBA02]